MQSVHRTAARPHGGRPLDPRAVRLPAVAEFWWEDPARLLLYFILPLYALISFALLGEQKAIDVIYFDSAYALIGGAFLLAMLASAWAVRTLATPAASPAGAPAATIRLPVFVLDGVFALALIGYVFMMAGVISDPALLVSFFTGGANAYDLLETKGRVVGISTLTQAAVAYVPLYFYVFRERTPAARRYTLYLLVLVMLTLLRSFIFAERLALLEVVLPIVLLYARFRPVPHHSTLLTMGPFAAIVPMVGFFIANEYNRSWETHYVNFYDNIFEFALERLSLYYSTAINNGAGLLHILGWGMGKPVFTFDWLVRFPLIGDTMQALVGNEEGYMLFLDHYGDPEFNNPSGIFVHFYEWGWFALLLAAGMGAVLGKSHAAWRAGNGFWCCAHAVLLVSLLEVLRIPNLFSGRNFVPLALLFLVFQCFGRRVAQPPLPTVQPTRSMRPIR